MEGLGMGTVENDNDGGADDEIRSCRMPIFLTRDKRINLDVLYDPRIPRGIIVQDFGFDSEITGIILTKAAANLLLPKLFKTMIESVTTHKKGESDER